MDQLLAAIADAAGPGCGIGDAVDSLLQPLEPLTRLLDVNLVKSIMLGLTLMSPAWPAGRPYWRASASAASSKTSVFSSGPLRVMEILENGKVSGLGLPVSPSKHAKIY